MDNSIPAGNNIVFDEKGIPANHYGKPVSDDSIKTRLRESLVKEYEPVRDLDGNLEKGEAKHVGKTRIEVITDKLSQRAAEGDLQATKEILDRTVGKPKQTIETTGTVQLSFQDWIDQRIQQNPNFLLAPQTNTGTQVIDVVPKESQPQIDYEGLKGF